MISPLQPHSGSRFNYRASGFNYIQSACNARDPGSIPGWGRSAGEGIGYPLQYSDLENSMDCTVHGVAKCRTRLSNFHFQLVHSCWCLVKVSVRRSVVSDSVTPWTVAHQAPLCMEFSRQEYWSGLPFPSPGDLLNQGSSPGLLQEDSLLSEPPRSWCPRQEAVSDLFFYDPLTFLSTSLPTFTKVPILILVSIFP